LAQASILLRCKAIRRTHEPFLLVSKSSEKNIVRCEETKDERGRQRKRWRIEEKRRGWKDPIHVLYVLSPVRDASVRVNSTRGSQRTSGQGMER
jgi:hypothetical protein